MQKHYNMDFGRKPFPLTFSFDLRRILYTIYFRARLRKRFKLGNARSWIPTNVG